MFCDQRNKMSVPIGASFQERQNIIRESSRRTQELKDGKKNNWNINIGKK